MKVDLVRVDDRLVHGQVVLGWTRALGVSHILIADDKAATDSLQRSLMTMAAPSGVSISICSIAEAAAELNSGENTHTLVLVRGPKELKALRDAGASFDKVNVGNVHTGPGRVKLTKEVHATQEELGIWRGLAEAGIALEAQWLPGQNKTDIGKLVLNT